MKLLEKKRIWDNLVGFLLFGLLFIGFACGGGGDGGDSPAPGDTTQSAPEMENYSVGPHWFGAPDLSNSTIDGREVSLAGIPLQGNPNGASADITLGENTLNVETGTQLGTLNIQVTQPMNWNDQDFPTAGEFQVEREANGFKNTVTVSVNPDVDGEGRAGVDIAFESHMDSLTWEQFEGIGFDAGAELHERIASFSFGVCEEVFRQVMNGFQDLFDPPLPPWHEPEYYWFGTSPEDYARLGILPGPPEVWEDGLRTDPNAYSFEWWYNDAHFTDGSSVVVVYFTKPTFSPGLPLTPWVSIAIVTPQGDEIEKSMQYDPADSFFSADSCDIEIGPNYINGDLATYVIYARIEDVEINLTLKKGVPSWRPATGHIFFGEQGEDFFAWIPAVPYGSMFGTMTYNGETHQVTGSGYHDHNWGSTDVSKHLKYWWWTRAQVGPYTVIAVNQRIKNKYGNNQWAPVFVVLDENGVLIDRALPGVTMTHRESDLRDHPDTNFCGKIAHALTFSAEKDNGDWAEIVFEAQQLLASEDLLPLSGMSDAEILFARLLGKSPWYTRFASKATLTFGIDGVQYSGVGLSTVELMDLE